MKSKTKLKINTALFSIIVIACVIAVNAIVYIVSEKKPVKIDLTRDKIYEFSDETKELVGGLEDDVKIYSVFPKGSAGEYITYIEEYLDKYKALSNKISVQYVDPNEDPVFINQYKSKGESINTYDLIVTCGDKYKVVPSSGFYSQSQYGNDVSIDIERKVTTAIMSVVGTGAAQKAYFVEGHGEINHGVLEAALQDDGYECEMLNTAISEIPEDCSLLVALSASEDYTAEEIEKLDAYFDNGGHAMIAFSPGIAVPERLGDYLADWGISVNNDFVVETDKNHAYMTQSGMVIAAPDMAEHDITSKIISKNLVYLAPYSRSVVFNESNSYHTTFIPLLETTEDSYSKDINSDTLDKASGDADGPFCVAGLVEKNTEDGVARIFVTGSAQAIENSMFMDGTYANSDFIRNTAAYMTEKTETLSIRAKTISADALEMSQLQAIFTGILIVLLLPLIILIYGLAVWAKRRHL